MCRIRGSTLRSRGSSPPSRDFTAAHNQKFLFGDIPGHGTHTIPEMRENETLHARPTQTSIFQIMLPVSAITFYQSSAEARTQRGARHDFVVIDSQVA